MTVEELKEWMQQVKYRAADSPRDVAVAMATVGERAIKLELSRSSHPAGTKTPAQPYADPPSLISGRLRASTRRTRLFSTGFYTWTARIAPTTRYARIQELGGWTGRHHKSHLPPRPYVRPARLWSQAKARDVGVKTFRQKTGL
jgi:phage gpG-like protein